MIKNRTQFIILVVAATLVLFSLVLFVSKQMGHLKLDKQITQLRKVTFLVHAMSDDDDYFFSVLITIFPKEKKVALFFVNPLASFESEETSLEKLKSGAPKTVENEIADILGFNPNYTVTIHEKNFKKIIDFSGGLPVFFEPKTALNTDRYNRPSNGFYTLDGSDAYDYLTALSSKKALDYVARLERQESAILSYFFYVQSLKETIKKPWISFLYSLIQTNLDENEFTNLIEFLISEDIGFGISELPGELVGVPNKDESLLKVRSDTAKIAYKKFEADVLSEFFADSERGRTEVLNGTPINGLAKKAKSLLGERRIKVLSVENAWESDFKETFVIDRSGNTRLSEKVYSAMGEKNRFFVIRKELGLDVTVVLGEDFDKTKQ
ncbi:LCP family protein [Leptospira sp. GIMC2001]|uniref:LCP family protein n=1 Tax=Leptospira sp. GIMC2001 TaxID=1513297 RepID=UPI002348F594|nr:LytR C-terminal domain-containing protein [Leptospira sp. GIMC2001]WCL47964.1 LytR C-terminal domain-containing protein [Leptospira sp. GIMC2001]